MRRILIVTLLLLTGLGFVRSASAVDCSVVEKDLKVCMATAKVFGCDVDGYVYENPPGYCAYSWNTHCSGGDANPATDAVLQCMRDHGHGGNVQPRKTW
jgi:hypothetical protein